MINLLIDSKYFCYKSLSANVNLSYNDINTTMYYLLLDSLKSIYKKVNADNVTIMFDSDHSFRRNIFPEYKIKKKNRNDPGVEKQIVYIKTEYPKLFKEMKQLGFSCFLRNGLEADDLFALYCEQHPNQKIIIATRDNDIYQLLDESVSIYDPHEKILLTKKWFIKKYEFEPKTFVKYKMINGCSSDCVPGIPGIGEKYTLQYLQGKASDKIIDKIESNWHIAERNKELVQLPFNIDREKKKLYTFKVKQTYLNLDRFIDLCQRYNFRSFLEDIKTWEKLFCKKE